MHWGSFILGALALLGLEIAVSGIVVWQLMRGRRDHTCGGQHLQERIARGYTESRGP